MSSLLLRGCTQCPIALFAPIARNLTAMTVEGVLPRSWHVSSVEGFPLGTLAMRELNDRTGIPVTRFLMMIVVDLTSNRVEGVLPTARRQDRLSTVLCSTLGGVTQQALTLKLLAA